MAGGGESFPAGSEGSGFHPHLGHLYGAARPVHWRYAADPHRRRCPSALHPVEAESSGREASHEPDSEYRASAGHPCAEPLRAKVARRGATAVAGRGADDFPAGDSAFKKARIRAAKKWQEKFLRPAHDGFARIRIHDLKHTLGRRLRAAGVTEEDRKALLGHKNGSITSHYSAAELDQLIAAANKVSATDSRTPALTILKRREA